MPTFADRESHVVRVTDPYGNNKQLSCILAGLKAKDPESLSQFCVQNVGIQSALPSYGAHSGDDQSKLRMSNCLCSACHPLPRFCLVRLILRTWRWRVAPKRRPTDYAAVYPRTLCSSEQLTWEPKKCVLLRFRKRTKIEDATYLRNVGTVAQNHRVQQYTRTELTSIIIRYLKVLEACCHVLIGSNSSRDVLINGTVR
jgi:hypothetical protein